MTAYTKEYISQLLDRFMEGTSTIEEEDILSQFFAQGQVPAEWEKYRLLFEELETMRPTPIPQHPSPWHRWLGWSVAAAIACIGLPTLWNSLEQQPETPLVAERQTEQKDTIVHVVPKNERPADTASVKTHDDAIMHKQRRSVRKPEPTITDNDKAAFLMAEAELEEQEVEQQIEQVRMELIHQRMVDAGYVAVTLEDGTIIYINEPNEFFAYEE